MCDSQNNHRLIGTPYKYLIGIFEAMDNPHPQHIAAAQGHTLPTQQTKEEGFQILSSKNASLTSIIRWSRRIPRTSKHATTWKSPFSHRKESISIHQASQRKTFHILQKVNTS
ncbi:MAG TPA: hypothetical protein DCE42_07540 [Myxococcales bacterium]|nr:hypothetical protein [Myxococcales bacterium]